jgi:hypothetical protein
MCPILDGYGVMGIFKFPYMPSCEPRHTEPAGGWCTELAGLSFVLQAVASLIFATWLTQFTTEW